MASPPIGNPSLIPPSWYDATWDAEQEPEWRLWAPVPGTVLPCGCHLRRPDLEAVLCEEHLAEMNGVPSSVGLSPEDEGNRSKEP